MGFKRPQETRIEVSGYTQSHEASTVLWNVEQAFEGYGTLDLQEDPPGYNGYSDLKNYKVTLVIEEV